jgi:hypothetical protein
MQSWHRTLVFVKWGDSLGEVHAPNPEHSVPGLQPRAAVPPWHLHLPGGPGGCWLQHSALPYLSPGSQPLFVIY